jgi:hypothetical protein
MGVRADLELDGLRQRSPQLAHRTLVARRRHAANPPGERARVASPTAVCATVVDNNNDK